jgi:hypothetical protein
MIGFRILPRTRQLPAALIEGFRSVPVANVSDCMGRMIAGGAHLRPYHKAGDGWACVYRESTPG